ncbi:MAG TPA: endonuclease/exonuclease/phosphatase family protein, partial [Pseudoxanthomonas sp.]
RPIDPASRGFFHPDATWKQLRLSSKSHWDVPVRTPDGVLHFLVSHPTPPVFDGPEDRNGKRNHDEIRLWAEYLSPGDKPWLCDDQGRCGGLAVEAKFVIAGDMNADASDGAAYPGAIGQLLRHPRVDDGVIPRSEGAVERAAAYGLPRKGDTANHTGDFGPKSGTLRLDYVLPSKGLRLTGNGVFWPAAQSADAAIADGSDHHLIWIDLAPL